MAITTLDGVLSGLMAAQAFAADDFALAAELAAEARATVEGVDPSYTVLQLDDGRLAVCPQSALKGPDVNIPALNVLLAKELDDLSATSVDSPSSP